MVHIGGKDKEIPHLGAHHEGGAVEKRRAPRHEFHMAVSRVVIQPVLLPFLFDAVGHLQIADAAEFGIGVQMDRVEVVGFLLNVPRGLNVDLRSDVQADRLAVAVGVVGYVFQRRVHEENFVIVQHLGGDQMLRLDLADQMVRPVRAVRALVDVRVEGVDDLLGQSGVAQSGAERTHQRQLTGFRVAGIMVNEVFQIEHGYSVSSTSSMVEVPASTSSSIRA